MKLVTFNNINYVIGKNAQDNWDIFEKANTINPDYIWFHLNSFPSSYVIMYATLKELRDNSYNDYLNYGAQLCKNNSKYRDLKNIKICYTSLKKLKKTEKIGELNVSGKKNIIKI
tara:strand:- start:994 stop:1338 length:345 start_codon:yes stop_codon:yes gene_type:complete